MNIYIYINLSGYTLGVARVGGLGSLQLCWWGAKMDKSCATKINTQKVTFLDYKILYAQ